MCFRRVGKANRAHTSFCTWASATADAHVRVTRAEDGGADAHIGGAKGDGLLEVAAHAHAQLFQAEPRGDLGEQRKMHGRLLVEGRDAHQAFDHETVFVPASRHKGVRLAGKDAGFLRLFAGIHLHQQARVLSGARQISSASAAAIFGRSTLWITSNSSTASRTLFDCSGPMR